jgi:radical SAM superfamily enzyme YgiQ (UPF0313 family)
MILVHPPVVKPSEPPPGIAKLAGSLKRHGVSCHLVDANIEGILYLLHQPIQSPDTWTSRALLHLPRDLEQLRSQAGYENRDRYRQAVLHLNRILTKSGFDKGARLSLANYTDQALSPLRSRDLLRAAEQNERNLFFPYFAPRLKEIFEEGVHSAIGFSLNYLSQALCTFAMAGFIRERYPSMKIILGGGLATSWIKRVGWSNPFSGLIDEMVAGPGEQWLVSFLGHEYEPGADVPDYDPLLECRYFSPGFVLPFSASSGCYWHKCRFCPEEAEGNRYRPIPPAQAVEAAARLAAKTKASLVHFVDNALSPAFLQEIVRCGFNRPWYGFVRATSMLADSDFVHLLKRSGCLMLKLGIESGSQEVLDVLEKGIDLETASGVLKALSSAGIGTYVYLLFGTPPEDRERARQTLSFTVGHSRYIDFLNGAIFNMPICSTQAEDYRTSPFYEGDLSLYTAFDHPLGWGRNLVRAFIEKEFSRHPAIASILRRQPPLFTSNHAPFFMIGRG